MQADGKILVTGAVSVPVAVGYINAYDFLTVRYNPDGSLDTTFGIGGVVVTHTGFLDVGNSIAVLPDGKILMCGEDGSNQILIRYNPDGTLDNSFGEEGVVIARNVSVSGNIGKRLAIQSDGKYLVAASNDHHGYAVLRYNPDGSLDTTFDVDGLVTASLGGSQEIAYGLASQADGKI